MQIVLLLSAIPLLMAPAPLDVESGAPQRVEVILMDFSYSPRMIRLRADEQVVLRLTNRGSGGHNFSAPEFFAKARLDPASAALAGKGKVEVKKGASVDLTLTPAGGRYKLKCTHFLHNAFGMKGEIIVE